MADEVVIYAHCHWCNEKITVDPFTNRWATALGEVRCARRAAAAAYPSAGSAFGHMSGGVGWAPTDREELERWLES